jgi:dTDP-4-dehydrorhamnose 3,5-epimerase-like enzyme
MDLTPAAKRAFQIQSYRPGPSIDGVEIVELKRFSDDGGSMTELARVTAGHPQAFGGFELRQINYSEVEPGAIKAFHLHQRQTDVWYVPPSDRMLLVLLDVRLGSKTEGTRMRLTLGDGASRLVRIPPGVAHGVRNLSSRTGRIIYFTDLHFSPEPSSCDEGRLPWDHAGAEIWDVVRG